MDKIKLVISDELKLQLDELRLCLAGVNSPSLDNEPINQVTACGAHCMVTCAWYCEWYCEKSCGGYEAAQCGYKPLCLNALAPQE